MHLREGGVGIRIDGSEKMVGIERERLRKDGRYMHRERERIRESQ